MKIRKIDNYKTNQNFGMKFNPKTLDNFVNDFTISKKGISFFSTSLGKKQIVKKTSQMASDAVTFKKYNIIRKTYKFPEGTLIGDTVNMSFIFRFPKNKKQKVTYYLSTNSFMPRDIVKSLGRVVSKLEDKQLKNFISEKAQKGELFKSAKELIDMYPQKSQFIHNQMAKYSYTNFVAKNMIEAGFSHKQIKKVLR